MIITYFEDRLDSSLYKAIKTNITADKYITKYEIFTWLVNIVNLALYDIDIKFPIDIHVRIKNAIEYIAKSSFLYNFKNLSDTMRAVYMRQ